MNFFQLGLLSITQSMKRFQLLRQLQAYRFMNGFKRVQDGSFLILSFRKRFSGSFRPASYRLFSMTVAHFNKYSDWSREDLIKKIRELERYGTWSKFSTNSLTDRLFCICLFCWSSWLQTVTNSHENFSRNPTTAKAYGLF